MLQIPQTFKNRAQKANLCLYHDPCTDGFMANYLFHKYNNFGPAVKSIPVDHRTKGTHEHQDYVLKQAAGKRVVLYDFSYRRPFLLRLSQVTNEITVFDHHVSAQRDVGDLDFCYFDMEKSGAMLAYESLGFPLTPYYKASSYPFFRLITHIQDIDLHGPTRPTSPNSPGISIWVNSYPRTLESYRHLNCTADSIGIYNTNINLQSQAIRRVQDRHVDACLNQREKWFISGLDGVKIGYAVNTNHLPSEVAGRLAEEGSFGGTYWIKDGQMTWSLRSTAEDGTDVSKLAGSFPGGGGHERAAGFTIPLGRVDFKRRIVK